MYLHGRKYPILGENFRKCPFLGENPENIPLWAKISKMPHYGCKCPFMGENFENTPFWAKISKLHFFGRNVKNTPNFGECAPFWAKIPKIHSFWAKILKIPHFGWTFWKYPILGGNAFFERKSRNDPILGRNAPLWGQISNIHHFRWKCPLSKINENSILDNDSEEFNRWLV